MFLSTSDMELTNTLIMELHVKHARNILRPKKERCLFPVACPKMVGRLFIDIFLNFIIFAKGDFVGKIRGKSGLQRKWLKIVKTVFFG